MLVYFLCPFGIAVPRGFLFLHTGHTYPPFGSLAYRLMFHHRPHLTHLSFLFFICYLPSSFWICQLICKSNDPAPFLLFSAGYVPYGQCRSPSFQHRGTFCPFHLSRSLNISFSQFLSQCSIITLEPFYPPLVTQSPE